MKDDIGSIRRSQIISTYGPGAIIDFRTSKGAPVSAISSGLDAWDDRSIRKGLLNKQKIFEPRLQKKLQVDGFRLPPVGDEPTGKRDAKGRPIMRPRQVPAVRFPHWHFCPSCDLLKNSRLWNNDMNQDGLYCSACSGLTGKPEKVFVVPVRFVVACENGHLEEFPWERWCEHTDDCKRAKSLKLVSRGSGLRGLFVTCTDCGGSRSLQGAFSQHALKEIGHKCSGKSPWLSDIREDCTQDPRVIQRGASNAYFSIVESAIDIPPWGDEFQESLGDHWKAITKSLDNPSVLPMYVENYIMDDWYGPETFEELLAKIKMRLNLISEIDTENLRLEEHAHLTSGQATNSQGETPSFQIHPEMIPELFNDHLQHLVRVERLREVRVLTGFTRLTAMSGENAEREKGRLSSKPKNWLPAVEVFGEGIFIGLDQTRLSKWESLPKVIARAKVLEDIAKKEWIERNGEESVFPFDISPRYVLIHTLAHAFINELALECGYSSSSIRERLYVGEQGSSMCGFLVYTSAPDADGTLGGLSRQGRSPRMATTLQRAIRGLEWCSSDPLCSDGLASFSDSSNLAACHTCSFLPETSCETFNKYLDRNLVVGTIADPELGFFNQILSK